MNREKLQRAVADHFDESPGQILAHVVLKYVSSDKVSTRYQTASDFDGGLEYAAFARVIRANDWELMTDLTRAAALLRARDPALEHKMMQALAEGQSPNIGDAWCVAAAEGFEPDDGQRETMWYTAFGNANASAFLALNHLGWHMSEDRARDVLSKAQVAEGTPHATALQSRAILDLSNLHALKAHDARTSPAGL